MKELAAVLIVCIVFAAGWFSREIWHRLKLINNKLASVISTVRPKEEETPKASFAEPKTALQAATEEETARIKALNPDL